MDWISDPRSVIRMDMDMDRLKKNLVPIRSESESGKLNGYEYKFRSIRSKLDPLTDLHVCSVNFTQSIFILANSFSVLGQTPSNVLLPRA